MIIIENSGESVEFGLVDKGQAFYYEDSHWIKAVIPRNTGNVGHRNDSHGAVNLKTGCWIEMDPKDFVEVVDAIVTIGKAT